MDNPTPGYRLPAISIRATYAATDGSMPEEVTVEFDGDAAHAATASMVIQQLLEAPRCRPLADWERELIEKEIDDV